MPEYEDHVTSTRLIRPPDQELIGMISDPLTETIPISRPFHPAFGWKSSVKVRAPPRMGASSLGPSVSETSLRLGAPLDIELEQEDQAQLVPLSSFSTGTSRSGSSGPPTQTAAAGPPVAMTFAEAYRTRAGPVDFRFSPQPSSDHRMFHSSGPRGPSFTIRLSFTGFVRATQNYRVYATMPVRVLNCRIAFYVVCIDPRGIKLYVEDRLLFHKGTISDHFDPDHPNVPTPYVVPGSVVEVRLVPIGAFGPALMPLPALLPILGLRPGENENDVHEGSMEIVEVPSNDDEV